MVWGDEDHGSPPQVVPVRQKAPVGLPRTENVDRLATSGDAGSGEQEPGGYQRFKGGSSEVIVIDDDSEQGPSGDGGAIAYSDSQEL